MKTITKEELKAVLEKHKLWVETNGKEGERANIQATLLMWANLEQSNLAEINLIYANLEDANRVLANLKNVDLEEANLNGTEF